MTRALRTEIETESQPSPREKPWLFGFLIAPVAVISIGLVSGAFGYLLRNEGVDPARSASLVALLSLPHTIYFLWGPLTDFWMGRRMWLMVAALGSASILVVAFHQPRLGSPIAVALLFLSACLGVLVAAACGGMMGTLESEANRCRAGSFYQGGSLAIGGIAVFVLVSLAAQYSIGALGWIIAAMIVIPSLAAMAAPVQAAIGGQTMRNTAAHIWYEFKETFLRWEAIPYALLITFPMCSGAMIGLLPELARDYGVSGQQVAWINGLGGSLLMAVGALAASLVSTRVRAPVAYLLAGLLNALTLAILSLGPQRPAVYFAGTVLFLFTIGTCYAFFTGVSLEFLGSSGKSGSSRYAIINSLGNIPVAYMAYLDGRAYAHWGPRAMPAADAVLSAIGASLLLAHFAFARRSRLWRFSSSLSPPSGD